jgi:HEAT repeat protein
MDTGVQPVLGTLLKDSDTKIRKASIMALGKQRERALPVVPDLLDMLKQDSKLADLCEVLEWNLASSVQVELPS